jgi:hypothetical protein
MAPSFWTEQYNWTLPEKLDDLVQSWGSMAPRAGGLLRQTPTLQRVIDGLCRL